MALSELELNKMTCEDFLRLHLTNQALDSVLVESHFNTRNVKTNNGVPHVILRGYSKNWLDKKDIAYLWRLAESKQKCMPTMAYVSSYFPEGQSTIGIESMYLIARYHGSAWLTSDRFSKKIGQDSLLSWIRAIESKGW